MAPTLRLIIGAIMKTSVSALLEIVLPEEGLRKTNFVSRTEYKAVSTVARARRDKIIRFIGKDKFLSIIISLE